MSYCVRTPIKICERLVIFDHSEVNISHTRSTKICISVQEAIMYKGNLLWLKGFLVPIPSSSWSKAVNTCIIIQDCFVTKTANPVQNHICSKPSPIFCKASHYMCWYIFKMHNVILCTIAEPKSWYASFYYTLLVTLLTCTPTSFCFTKTFCFLFLQVNKLHILYLVVAWAICTRGFVSSIISCKDA